MFRAARLACRPFFCRKTEGKSGLILKLLHEREYQNIEIQSVHDYHVWTISNDMNALSCHAVVPDTLTVKDCEQLLKRIEHDLLHLNIQHMTIQLETANHDHDETTLCTGVHHH